MAAKAALALILVLCCASAVLATRSVQTYHKPECSCDKDCGSADQCNTVKCVEGKCVKTPEDGCPCDDGNSCTYNDKCQHGYCKGEDVKCYSKDYSKDQCKEAKCNPKNGQCEAVWKPDGTCCDDGSACTTDDKCWGGCCKGNEVKCYGDNNVCKKTYCNPLTGQCTTENTNEGGSCDDGNSCTENDRCCGGVCKGTEKKCHSNNPCEESCCDPSTGQCKSKPANDGQKCDDGNHCTENDVCCSGYCKGTEKKCYGNNNVCVKTYCNPLTGECKTESTNEGGKCDDGNSCTENDVCCGGVCKGTEKKCHSNNPCEESCCDPSTGQCKSKPANDGKKCDDGNTCTENDVCCSGYCKGTEKKCYGDGNVCKKTYCDAHDGQCKTENTNDGGKCDDGNKCTYHDVCCSGYCKGTEKKCYSDGNPCIKTYCNPLTGHCKTENINEGGKCDDGNPHTCNDRCCNGVCKGSSDPPPPPPKHGYKAKSPSYKHHG